MKKSLFSIAVLSAFAGISHAETTGSVTLYGVVDANIEYATNLPNAAMAGGSGNRVAVNSGGLSGSRFGLRGSEDLGGGLSALFTLENGFNVDDGKMQQGGRLFGRQAYVGLNSNAVGQFTFGRQYTPMFQLLGDFVPTRHASQYEPIVVLTGSNNRSDNTAMYTGVFGPVTALAYWSFGTGASSVNPTGGGSGEVPGQFKRDSGYGAGVAYAAGPFGATLIYDQFNPSVSAKGGTFATGAARKAAVAGSYEFGPAKLMAGYRWGQNKNPDSTLALRDDLYWIGATYQATGALGLVLAYYYENLKNLGGITTGLSKPWQMTAQANYGFSKRTDIYVTTAYAKHAGLDLSQSGVDANVMGYPLAPGKTSMFAVAVGIRNKF